MSLGWMMLVLVGWILLTLVALTLVRMSGDQDRDARRAQKDLDPYYDDGTITRSVG